MSEERKLFYFCAAIVLLGAIAIAWMLVPEMIADSKLPVTHINY